MQRNQLELKKMAKDPDYTKLLQKIRGLLETSGHVTTGQKSAVLALLAGRLAGYSDFSQYASANFHRQGHQEGKEAREKEEEAQRYEEP